VAPPADPTPPVAPAVPWAVDVLPDTVETIVPDVYPAPFGLDPVGPE